MSSIEKTQELQNLQAELTALKAKYERESQALLQQIHSLSDEISCNTWEMYFDHHFDVKLYNKYTRKFYNKETAYRFYVRSNMKQDFESLLEQVQDDCVNKKVCLYYDVACDAPRYFHVKSNGVNYTLVMDENYSGTFHYPISKNNLITILDNIIQKWPYTS